MPNKKTVVIGASKKPGRYANLAVSRLISNGHEVVPLGLQTGTVSGLEILTGKPEITDVHTITMYIRPEIQKDLYTYLLSLKPKRIIFNPGTENAELEKLARNEGIEVEEACTLVMLSVNDY
jgi:uncharacterized protein